MVARERTFGPRLPPPTPKRARVVRPSRRGFYVRRPPVREPCAMRHEPLAKCEPSDRCDRFFEPRHARRAGTSTLGKYFPPRRIRRWIVPWTYVCTPLFERGVQIHTCTAIAATVNSALPSS